MDIAAGSEMVLGCYVVGFQPKQVAMGLYYAEQSFSLGPGGGFYTDDLVSNPVLKTKVAQVALLPFLSWPDPDPELLLGVCSSPPVVTLG